MRRRDLLAALPAIAMLPRMGQADAHTGQIPPIMRHRIGDWTLTALSDGHLVIGAEALNGIDAAGFDALLAENHVTPGSQQADVNAYILDTGDRVIMIDVGTGQSAAFPTLGRIGESMAASGYGPEDVTDILITHLHPDHVGGALAPDGTALYPNANMIVSETDHAFWTDEGIRAGAPENARPFFDLAVAALAAYDGRLNLISGAETGLPGISAEALPGHTPGHLGYRIEQGDGALFLWADLVHVPEVQFDRPDVTIAFDVDTEAAAATRARVLDMAATDGLRVGGMHMPFPGLGHVERTGEAYRFVPEQISYF